MNQDPKQILLKILEIIGYTKDKDAFITEFLTLCQQQALGVVLNALPQETRQELEQRASGLQSQEEAGKLLQEYITPQQYQEALQTASQTAFEQWLQAVIPTLSGEQATTLQTYLSSLAQSNTPSS